MLQQPIATTLDANQTGPVEIQILDPRDSLDLYFARHRQRPARFAGQATPDFQLALRSSHLGLTPTDCDFYHTIETPAGSIYPGDWDLRGHETAYLGEVRLEGASVLEFGPASGWLSAFIAGSARLTILDLPWGEAPELIPFPGVDMVGLRRSAALSARRLRNSWWFTRQRLGFEATAVYADIYDLPSDIGRSTVSVFGAILLHLSNPFRALQQAAALTDETIVVTDLLQPGHTPAFNPSMPPVGHTHWWGMTPDFVEHMLKRLGFGDVVRTTHSPPRMASAPQLFTVVGRKPRTSVAVHAPKATARTLPVPPGSLRHLVAGTEDEAVFIKLGSLAFEALTASLRAHGTDPSTLGRVLDFGCGVGRVTRHWANYPSVAVDGSDLSAEMVAWNQANLPFGTFRCNTLDPVLDFADAQFDLVYALSVLTHLPPESQRPWLEELVRVTRPGGLIYVTTHGEHYLPLLTEGQRQAFEQGHIVVTGEEKSGSNHCAAFHPPEWMRNIAAELGLTIIEHIARGARGNPEQDSWLLQR